jgi:methionyl-tRNA formyltransferase
LTPTPVGQYGLDEGLETVRTEDINGMSLPPADVLVVIAFGQKIAPHIVGHARLGAVNLHSSRLPRWRGAAPINWAVIAGDRVTGNSVIRLAEKMDAGAVLGQTELEIGETETAGELHDRLAEDGGPLVLKVLGELAAGTAVEAGQDHSKATLARKLSREATRLDWGRPARELANQIRGMYPWPGCRVRIVRGEQVLTRATLVRARAVELTGASRPGEISSAGTIATGDGAVQILEIQPEGKRPMSLDAFCNGRPWEPGMRLESLAE